MVEVRYLSVALLVTKGIRSGVKGNIAEIYISLPGGVYWVAEEYSADCHICEALP